MKNVYGVLLICCAILFGTAPLLAEEYTAPEGLTEAIYETYDLLTNTIHYNDHLFVDFYLLDENWFALSALEWGSNNQMPLEQIRAYYQESLAKYDPDHNFLLMAMLYDPQAELDPTQFTRQIEICKSNEEALSGTVIQNYDNSIFIISYPREQVEIFLQGEDTFTIRFWIHSTPSPEIAFDCNYKDYISPKISEFIQVLKKKQ